MKKKKIVIAGSIVVVVAATVCCAWLIHRRFSVKTIKDKKIVAENIVDTDISLMYYEDDGKLKVQEAVIGDSVKNKKLDTDKLCFYKMSKKDDALVKRIAKYHDLEDEQILEEKDQMIDRPYVRVYESGVILLDMKSSNNGPVTKTDDECRDIACNYLKELGIDVDDYKCSKVNSLTSEKTVHFSRVIDGKEIIGDDAISVTIIGDGKINGLLCNNTKVAEKYILSDDNIKDFEECLEEAENLKGCFQISYDDSIQRDEDVDEIDIDDVEIEYWEYSDMYGEVKDSAIVPVYKFTGEAKENGKAIADVSVVEEIIENGK